MSRSMKGYTHQIFAFPEPKHFICVHDEIVLEGHVDDEFWEFDLFNMEELNKHILKHFPDEAYELSHVEKIVKVIDMTGDVEEVRELWHWYFDDKLDSSKLSKRKCVGIWQVMLCRPVNASFVVAVASDGINVIFLKRMY